MFAVIETGGKQYKVEVGTVFDAEKISSNVGEKVVFSQVVLLSKDDGSSLVTSPVSVSVECEVISQHRGPKLIAFKKRRRHTYKRKKGHRQYITTLKVLSINC